MPKSSLPALGLPITAAQLKPGGFSTVAHDIAADAYEAHLEATKEHPPSPIDSFYPYLLPAKGFRNGAARFFGDGDTPPKPWVLIDAERYRIRSMSKEDVLTRLEKTLSRGWPTCGDEQILQSYAKFIMVAADGIGKLRRVDVYRVLVESNSEDNRTGIADFIRAKRPDLIDEVDEVLAEVEADRALIPHAA